jgi:hypothetical protein
MRLSNTNGLAFGAHGTAMSFNVLRPVHHPYKNSAGSLELWVRPIRWSNSATLVALYRPESSSQFTLHQSLNNLLVSTELRNRGRRDVNNHFLVDDALGAALRQKKTIFITITCNEQGTMVYLDGVLAKAEPRFHIDPEAFTGRVILGDSAWQPDSFRGQIRGLAVFESALDSTRVLQRYNVWTETGQPDVAQEDRDLAVYLFNERTGAIIDSHAEAAGRDLYIPESYEVIDKTALEPFWEEFDFSRSYWSGNIKNIIGFIPFGFCFSAYFGMLGRGERTALFTVVLGAIVSITIEICQAFLPTRDSGTTDLITNTIGTYLGVIGYAKVYPVVWNIVPWVARLVPVQERGISGP